MEFGSQNSDFVAIFSPPLLLLSGRCTKCQSFLMHLVESWKRALDRGENVGATMMDLSKAFYCLSRELLITKLSAHGFSNNACDFILILLSNRQ